MENRKLKMELPVGVLIHYHTTGGSFTVAEKLSKKINARLVFLSTGAKLVGNSLAVRVVKIFGRRVFASPWSFWIINKKVSAWHIHYASPIILPLFLVSRKHKILTYHYIFSDSPFLIESQNFLSKTLNLLLFLPLNILIWNIFAFLAYRITFITDAQKDGFRKNVLFKKKFDEKTITAPNFIESDLILKDKTFFNSSVLFVGRYTHAKGFDDLIKIVKEIPDVIFYLAGNSEIVVKLPNLHNLGKVLNDDMKNAYDKASILILPSRTEVFPMVILEAMARGLVILVSDLPGMREIMQEGRNGYFFPVGDTVKMKEIISYLRNNPQEIERISKNNLEDIWKFTAENQINKYIKLYEEVLN